MPGHMARHSTPFVVFKNKSLLARPAKDDILLDRSGPYFGGGILIFLPVGEILPNKPCTGSDWSVRGLFYVSFAKSRVSFFGICPVRRRFAVIPGKLSPEMCLFMSLSADKRGAG